MSSLYISLMGTGFFDVKSIRSLPDDDSLSFFLYRLRPIIDRPDVDDDAAGTDVIEWLCIVFGFGFGFALAPAFLLELEIVLLLDLSIFIENGASSSNRVDGLL